MRWDDERYVRVYTRDTGEWLALGWEAQALFLFALRKSDRAGIVRTGKAGMRGLSGMTGIPLDVVARALPLLLEDGCVRECDAGYIIPNFIAAQEVPISDAQRKRDQRERDRDKLLASGVTEQKAVADYMAAQSRRTVTPDVTPDGHAMASRLESRATVTSGHAGEVTPSRAVPSVPSCSDPPPASQRPEAPSAETIGNAAKAITTGAKYPSGPHPSPFALEAQPIKPARKQRLPTAAENLYTELQKAREARCVEVGEPVVEEKWPFEKRNTALKSLVEAPGEAQERFGRAWLLYLADDGQRAKEPAWSLSYFMSSGVRERYETRAARDTSTEAA